jgi:hypothetical protein
MRGGVRRALRASTSSPTSGAGGGGRSRAPPWRMRRRWSSRSTRCSPRRSRGPRRWESRRPMPRSMRSTAPGTTRPRERRRPRNDGALRAWTMLGSNQRPPPCRGGNTWPRRDRTGQEKPVDAGDSRGRPDLGLQGDTADFDPEGRTEDAASSGRQQPVGRSGARRTSANAGECGRSGLGVAVGYGSRPATALTSSCICATTRAAKSTSRSDASRSAASSCASSCAASAPAATRAT